MKNDKAFFGVLVQADWRHYAFAGRGAVAGDQLVNVPAVQTAPTMIAAGFVGRGIFFSAIEANKLLIDFDCFGHVLFAYLANYGKII
jgi:hypothetical protein